MPVRLLLTALGLLALAGCSYTSNPPPPQPVIVTPPPPGSAPVVVQPRS
jgi:hypothetical protein